jgi:hypothetical protein
MPRVNCCNHYLNSPEDGKASVVPLYGALKIGVRTSYAHLYSSTSKTQISTCKPHGPWVGNIRTWPVEDVFVENPRLQHRYSRC